MAFEVQLGDLRDAAGAARDAARLVDRSTAPDDLRGIVTGMPGAAAVELVGAVATGWEGDIDRWVAAARRYGRALDSAVDRYEADDEAARSAFRPAAPPGPR
ncbi:hypothetical protein [Nostocoides sp. Soil756]|uniref:hypothetical protein n=1 Tax=Nostocoides sp. Soil756 TaxID=1736399 RepID=UPI0006F59589|nr:hypothetical protein [Tetrasphaera sp. Soil756]KRE60965.1 hypothetical protein ASG78_11405 [Tetrasphaera sp. Soil756]